MNRKKFIALLGGSALVAGTGYYLTTDTGNLTRNDIKEKAFGKFPLQPDEGEILFLASLAPSAHNSQPWLVKYVAPYHWIICNDKSRWLYSVDPNQRETILSIGAFLQNLEYAAGNLGYNSQFKMIARTNQEANIVEVKLYKTGNISGNDIQRIKLRRTVRLNYLNNSLKKEDVNYLIDNEPDLIHYIPNATKEYQYLNEQTIEANKLQSYRDPAEKELANWIRFSSKDAEKHRDGLTTAGMDIEGLPGWVVRNFYGKQKVMEKAFREQNIANVVKQVSQSAGWILITSKDDSLAALLDTGKRMQRLFLKVREKGIAIHPMTQILEEPAINKMLNTSIGMKDPVQFILRAGYVKEYPKPVSLRCPVDWFIRSANG